MTGGVSGAIIAPDEAVDFDLSGQGTPKESRKQEHREARATTREKAAGGA